MAGFDKVAGLRSSFVKPRHTDHLVFDEGVGPVQVDFEMKNGLPHSLVMHQPLPTFSGTFERSTIARLLSLEPNDIDANFPVQVVSCGLPVIIVPLASLDSAARATVRLDLLESTLADVDCRQLFVFTQETEDTGADVHCRCFAPTFGIAEDPATGGAHGPLGSYLVKYGLSDGKLIVSEQGVEMGRPSRISVHIKNLDAEITDVMVGGDCVEVGVGSLRLTRSEEQSSG